MDNEKERDEGQRSQRPLCAHVAIRSKILEEIQLKSEGYELESEMLIKALKIGDRVEEIPITFNQRTVGRSRLDPVKDGARILFSMVKSS